MLYIYRVKGCKTSRSTFHSSNMPYIKTRYAANSCTPGNNKLPTDTCL